MQSGIDFERGIEAVYGIERRVSLESCAVEATEISILQVAIDDAVPAAENRVSLQCRRRPSKTNAGTEVFFPDVGPPLVRVSVSPGSCSSKYQRARQIASTGVWCGEADIGSVSGGFLLGFVDFVADTEIDGKGRRNLEAVLNKSSKVTPQPARLAGVGGNVCGAEFSQQQTGDSISAEIRSGGSAGGLGPTEIEGSAGVLKIERRVLLIPLFVAEF